MLLRRTALLGRAALLGALVARPLAAEPESGARVVVGSPSGASPLLQEALVRAQGELSAVGLRPELQLVAAGGRPAELTQAGVYGILTLESRGSRVLIRAYAPRGSEPIEAEVDTSAPGVTAEVIAVRAVETLRAAMLQYAQSTGGQLPPEVRGFTRFMPLLPPRSSEPAGAPAPAASAPSAHAPAAAPLAFWAGPAVSLHAGTSPDLGGQVGILVGPSYGFAAAAFETTLGELHLQADHGSVDVQRRAVWAQLGARFRPLSAWEITTRAGLGYAAFALRGEGDPGYRGRSATHGSVEAMLGVSTAYWATRGFGLYASVGGRLALDAPTVQVAGKAVITLDRPSFVLSLGATVGVF